QTGQTRGFAGRSIRSEVTRPSDGIGNWCVAPSRISWYHVSHPTASPTEGAREPSQPETALHTSVLAHAAGTGKKNRRGKRSATAGVLANGEAFGARMVGALDHAQALLERLVATAPTSCVAAPSQMA